MPTKKIAATPASPPRYATVKEAAEAARVSPETIRRMLAKGQLTTYAYGRRIIRVDLNEIDALLAAGGR